jgi:hypothetical protein
MLIPSPSIQTTQANMHPESRDIKQQQWLLFTMLTTQSLTPFSSRKADHRHVSK